MSASPVARQVTQSQAIPRRITITSTSQLPNEYSTTPGGTIYSTTPGGKSQESSGHFTSSIVRMRN